MKSAKALADRAQSAQSWIMYGVIGLLLVMPFHACLVIVAGHVFGHQAMFQAWKEVLLITMLVAAGLVWLGKGKLPIKLHAANRVALAIIVMGLGLSAVHFTGSRPFIYGVKITLLPLVAFLLAQVARRVPTPWLEKLVLWPSYAVAVLALAQEYAVPARYLEAIGYGPTTIKPIQLVDPAVASIRAFSTLGGPNQLGAYLILPTVFGIVLAWKRRNVGYLVGAVLTTAGLVVSFSRSAWLGLAAALVAAVFLLGNRLVRLLMVVATVTVLVAYVSLSATFSTQLKNTQIQYYLLHGRYNEEHLLEGSDANRAQAQTIGLEAVRQHPLGLGLGSAGPASFQSSQPLITENWYLQIAIELGVIGLVFYVLFFGLSFWQAARLDSPLGLALGSSLVGLSLTGMFLHVWGDSTLALMIFSLLGITAAEQKS